MDTYLRLQLDYTLSHEAKVRASRIGSNTKLQAKTTQLGQNSRTNNAKTHDVPLKT